VKQSLGTILTAMVTPFDGELAVDHARLAALSSHLLDNGSDGLVVAGTTGESPTLTDEEKLAMFRTVVEAVGDRAPVVAGTGSNDTAHSVRLTRAAEACGVDAVLVVTPYYNKPPERGLIAHFRAVAAATSLPVIVYNIPGRCVVNLSAEAIAELATVENIVAVKQADPDVEHTRRLREICDIEVYAGNDDMLLDVLELGGAGGICVASHLVGAQLADMARLVRAGEHEKARILDDSLREVYRVLFITASPIPVKTAMNLLGHEVGGLRLPLVDATDEETAIVAAELRRLGLLL
jgi:4-hydroxy-tetrahydrodipicolinate synthase